MQRATRAPASQSAQTTAPSATDRSTPPSNPSMVFFSGQGRPPAAAPQTYPDLYQAQHEAFLDDPYYGHMGYAYGASPYRRGPVSRLLDPYGARGAYLSPYPLYYQRRRGLIGELVAGVADMYSSHQEAKAAEAKAKAAAGPATSATASSTSASKQTDARRGDGRDASKGERRAAKDERRAARSGGIKFS